LPHARQALFGIGGGCDEPSEFGGEDGFGEQGNVLGGDIRDTGSDIAPPLGV